MKPAKLSRDLHCQGSDLGTFPRKPPSSYRVICCPGLMEPVWGTQPKRPKEEPRLYPLRHRRRHVGPKERKREKKSRP